MSKEEKGKSQIHETLKALYFSGKVKPTLNKVLIELESNPKNLRLNLLACQCLLRAKDYDELSSRADACLKLPTKNAQGFYFKGVALHHTKGKEQDALKNLNEALFIDPENPVYLLCKAQTHLLLFTNYHLPIKFAEKHRIKAEESLLKIIETIGQKKNPDYVDFLAIGDASMMISQNIDAKKYYINAVNAFEAADKEKQDKNVYKDIIRSQKACVKAMESTD